MNKNTKLIIGALVASVLAVSLLSVIFSSSVNALSVPVNRVEIGRQHLLFTGDALVLGSASTSTDETTLRFEVASGFLAIIADLRVTSFNATSTFFDNLIVNATSTFPVGDVVIGTSTPPIGIKDSALLVQPFSADEHGIIIQGFTGQSEHIFMILNDVSQQLLTVAASGEVEIFHTATEDGDHALHIEADSNGFGGVNGLFIDYDTGNIAGGEEASAIFITLDRLASTGGEVHGIVCNATSGSAQAECLEVGAGAIVIEQHIGTFGDMDSCTQSPGLTDILSSCTSVSTDATLFTNNTDQLVIGDAAKFSQLEVQLATNSNKNINATFEFSTGSDTWTFFAPNDGTIGFQDSALITWEVDDLSGWATGTSTRFYIRIIRTRVGNISTLPVEDLLQISATTEAKWDENGVIQVPHINATTTLIDTLTLTNALTVANGGTGISSCTNGGLILGSGTDPFTCLGVAANGQIPIGDGTDDPVLNEIDGTANEITVTNGSGTITLSIPDAVTLVTLTLTNDLTVANGGTGASTLTDGGVLLGSGTSAITAMAVLGDGAIIVGDNSTDPVALTAFTSSTGDLRHEAGGLEFDASAITTGGIVRGASSGVMSILAVGTDGQVLTAQADGSVDWEAVPASTGAPFAWTDNGGYVATTTVLLFDTGFFSNASSSILANFKVEGQSTSTLSVWIGTGGVADNLDLTGGDLYVQDDLEVDGTIFTADAQITGGAITGITDIVVADGGTGFSSCTDGGLILGSGTNPFTCLGEATNGQIPIGDGTTDPQLATITGTANEITVTNGSASITLSIPDAVTLVTLTLTNDLAVANGGTGASSLTDNAVLIGSGTGAITALGVGTNGQILIGSTSADPTFATLTCDANLTCTTGAGTLEIDLDTTLTGLVDITATGAIIFSDGSLEIPNGTAPTLDATGEIAIDTTDNQFLYATSTPSNGYPAVLSDKFAFVSFKLASTSKMFSGAKIDLPPWGDAIRIKEFYCNVEGPGTSVVFNLTNNAYADDTETITCDIDGASDTDVSTNNLIPASATSSIEIGTVTGAVDYLNIRIIGVRERE